MILASGIVVTVKEAIDAFPQLLVPQSLPVGLSLQAVLLPPADSSSSYVQLLYAAIPISANETDWDFYLDRGVIVTERPTTGQSADFIRQTIGSAAFEKTARSVAVGPWDAVAIHDSPLPNGARPYHLFWSDGTVDYKLGGSVTPAELVDVARSFYCGKMKIRVSQ